MNLYENELYNEDVQYVSGIDCLFKDLDNKKLLISGATGLIGSFFIDVILSKDVYCTIYAVCRDTIKAQRRFYKYENDPRLVFIEHDINNELIIDNAEKIDYVIHLASNTHPLQYSTRPIETITTNIIGLKNMLDCAVRYNADRFLFSSSNEIYGENRGDKEFFDENYCGYINSNTLRAGYPESKRCGEALCQAYITEKNIDIVIARVTRTYGPTMLMSDTKAINQFIKKGIEGEDIVLKSVGNQYYSFQYVSDTVSGLFYILFNGKNGEAYNIADEGSDITLKNLAETIAGICEKKVIFELPDQVESRGYSKATKARLDGSKLKELGWFPKYDISSGIKRTISILKSL